MQEGTQQNQGQGKESKQAIINCNQLQIKFMDNRLLSIHLTPLPPLQPRPRPQTQQQKNLPQKSLQKHKNSLTLSAVAQAQSSQQDSNIYRDLYQQKCEQQSQYRDRCQSQQALIKFLKEKNQSLQQDLKKFQEQRWNKYDYSRLSARGRSKSQRQVAPIIDVKVPNKIKNGKQILIEEEQYVKTDRDAYSDQLEYYKQAIKDIREENKQLKKQIEQIKANFQKQEGKREEKNHVTASKYIYSPQKQFLQQSFIQTPQISSFSPYPKDKAQTVKKQTNHYDDFQQQIKRLKNQLMYKDLLIHKLKVDHSKQQFLLKRHLQLSVIESRKISEQTSNIIASFKAQIVRLSQQIFQTKKKKQLITEQSQNISIDRPATDRDLLKLLKGRRNQQSFF